MQEVAVHGRRRARLRPLLLAIAVTTVAAACGASEAAGPTPSSGTIGGVGELPAPLTPSETAPTTSSSPSPSASSTTPADVVEATDGPIGERVDGNRVLLIGDSLMASTSRRYGGQMCLALVPLHWATEVDAETGRFIDFGMRVLDRRLRPDRGVDWDAVVVFLGNNYGSNPDVYRAGLEEIVATTAPRPTVLITVTEFRPDRAEVNEIIRSVADANDHVQVLDWATIAAENPSYQGDDGLHLTDSGRDRLAFEVAAVLGSAPTGEGGECLSTSFSDDSAGRPIPRTSPSAGTSSGNRTTTTTAQPGGTATTTAVTTSPTAAPQSTAGSQTTAAPPTTAAPQSTAPQTTPAPTSPPTTAAPTPPPTAAPTPPPTPPPTTTGGAAEG